ncbi:hypothetical protein ATCV1_z761L [Acanthocystis turfacea chlorella virus 1]|uniref:Uncharacterized protein z761L n=1 Tax=Chlorovirus heliozoae TaxID=322019 RepID=A7KA21_9PHYC|nr:hypothetical protein ATCV1_z761L [Acanthocystis turfacea chlorella virus 1]ABT16895.1 hypothetical protein ATCV1_z761L [Acanthocystis turfacea chlorella virus 1]
MSAYIPPPMSMIEILCPRETAMSYASLADLSAFQYASGLRDPDPTWNEMPLTFIPIFLACSRSGVISSAFAPYFSSLTRACGSSQRMRSTASHAGWYSFILSSSNVLSNVAMLTPTFFAYKRASGDLMVCAKRMRDGNAPAFKTLAISPFDAQSKLTPFFSRYLRRTGSSLHFTA